MRAGRAAGTATRRRQDRSQEHRLVRRHARPAPWRPPQGPAGPRKTARPPPARRPGTAGPFRANLPLTTNAGTAMKQQRRPQRLRREAARQRPHRQHGDQTKRRCTRRGTALPSRRRTPRAMPASTHAFQRRMRVPAQIHLIAQEDILDVIGMQRIDQRVRRLGRDKYDRRPESPD